MGAVEQIDLRKQDSGWTRAVLECVLAGTIYFRFEARDGKPSLSVPFYGWSESCSYHNASVPHSFNVLEEPNTGRLPNRIRVEEARILFVDQWKSMSGVISQAILANTDLPVWMLRQSLETDHSGNKTLVFNPVVLTSL